MVHDQLTAGPGEMQIAEVVEDGDARVGGATGEGWRPGAAVMTRSSIATFLSMIMAGAAAAGPFEDGLSAFERGDFPSALAIWQPLAERGDASAQFFLAGLYARGRGVARNDVEAANWYRKAAEQRHAGACYRLGVIYANGRGVGRSDAEAEKWYRMAAIEGDVGAQLFLAALYARGSGVIRDDAEAARWFREAAEQGNAGAQYRLAVLYHEGRGVPQSDVLAHMWSSLAAAHVVQGADGYAAFAGLVARRMTTDEVAEAIRLAAQWQPVKRRP